MAAQRTELYQTALTQFNDRMRQNFRQYRCREMKPSEEKKLHRMIRRNIRRDWEQLPLEAIVFRTYNHFYEDVKERERAKLEKIHTQASLQETPDKVFRGLRKWRQQFADGRKRLTIYLADRERVLVRDFSPDGYVNSTTIRFKRGFIHGFVREA
jgi:hypothetical protein